MKILVCGGRDFNDYEFATQCLNFLRAYLKSFTIIEGGARGADSLARKWAVENGVDFITVPADWNKHGKRAGPIRNQLMLDMNPNCVVAFEGGNGTAHMVTISRKKQIPVWEPKR